MRVRVCDAASPPPAMRLTIGFPPGFVAGRLAAGLLSIIVGFGVLLGLYAWALQKARAGKPISAQLTMLKSAAFALSLGWFGLFLLSGMGFVVTLLRARPRSPLRCGSRFSRPACAVILCSAVLRQRLQRFSVQPHSHLPTAITWFVGALMAVAAISGFVAALTTHPSQRPLHTIEHSYLWLIPALSVSNSFPGF